MENIEKHDTECENMGRRKTDNEGFVREPKKNTPSLSFIIIVTAALSICVTLGLVALINGGYVLYPKAIYGDMSKIAVVGEIIQVVEDEFYGDAPTEDELIAAAAKGAVAALDDPYAQYYTEAEYEEYSEQMAGSYSGLGITLRQPDDVGSLITRVYTDSPAKRAGICAGDIITHVDGVSIAGMDEEAFSEVLRGNAGESVTVFVLRDTLTKEFTMEYGAVTVDNTESKLLDNNIGYIHIDMFAGNTSEQFAQSYKELTQDGELTGLVIDLRNNPGGSLTSVIDIANQIIGSGVIVQIGNSLDDPALRVYEASGKNTVKVPITVLINENSASASEILAAAIKENKLGTIIGTTSFGKGIVQTTMPLAAMNSWLKLTTDGYYTPDGNSIHGKGVTPDIEVTLPESLSVYDIPNIPIEDDVQLARAIEKLLEG